jgi:hypothetical protein
MDIIANSDSEMDIAAAKVGRSALDAAEWQFKLRKKRKMAWWWMISTGLGAIFVGYDYLDDAQGHYEYLIDPMTNEPTFNEDRRKELQDMVDHGELDALTIERFPLGELEYKVYTPFQLFPDETVLDFDECKEIITAEASDVDVIKGMYGRAADDLTPEQVQLGVVEQRMMQRLGMATPQWALAQNGLMVYTLWLLPNQYRGNKFLKDGIFLRWTKGRRILDISTQKDNTGAFPLDDDRLPFVFFQHIPTNLSVWPDCTLTHIRGPNLEIDKTVSQLIENKDYMANPMWRIAAQHKIRGQIKNVAGAIVRYTHVPNIPPPEPVEGLQMPPQVENLLVGLREQILDISGQSEVARGRVPTGVRSGVAVAYLQEEDDTKIAPTIENLEDGVALMSSLTLCRFQQYYSTTRMMRYYKPDGTFDVIKFKGADLKGNTDVVPQAGSAMPRSKAAQQQYTLELVSLGILTDPEQIQERLELGQGEPSDNDKSRRQADRENQIMMHGLPRAMFNLTHTVEDNDLKKVAVAVPVKKWHNHPIHIARHTSVMMDPEFDEFQISHPEIVRLFDEHLAMHEALLAQAQQAQAQLMAAVKGAPGGPPAGQQANGAGAPGAPGAPADQGQGFNFNKTMSDVPDVIGGGVTRISAMRSHPPPK